MTGGSATAPEAKQSAWGKTAHAVGVLVGWADRIFNIIIVLLFAGIVVVGGIQVFCRYVLNASLSWSEEFQRYGLVWMVFLAIVAGYRRNAHIGMEVLLHKLPSRARAAMAWLIDLLWLALGLAMLVFTVFYRTPAGMTFLQSVGRQRSAGMGLRMDIVYACVVIGGAYLTLAAIHNLLRRAAGETLTAAAPPEPIDEC